MAKSTGPKKEQAEESFEISIYLTAFFLDKLALLMPFFWISLHC
jgi:hypothetical protein